MFKSSRFRTYVVDQSMANNFDYLRAQFAARKDGHESCSKFDQRFKINISS